MGLTNIDGARLKGCWTKVSRKGLACWPWIVLQSCGLGGAAGREELSLLRVLVATVTEARSQ